MTVITPDRMRREDESADGAAKQTHWISEPGGRTQFGAFLEVLGPGARSSLKHWHSADDELFYVLEGEVTPVEGDATPTYPDHDRVCIRDRSLPDDVWTDGARSPARSRCA